LGEKPKCLEKLAEKLNLFKSVDILIAPGDDNLITKKLSASELQCFYWGRNKKSDVKIVSI